MAVMVVPLANLDRRFRTVLAIPLTAPYVATRPLKRKLNAHCLQHFQCLRLQGNRPAGQRTNG